MILVLAGWLSIEFFTDALGFNVPPTVLELPPSSEAVILIGRLGGTGVSAAAVPLLERSGLPQLPPAVFVDQRTSSFRCLRTRMMTSTALAASPPRDVLSSSDRVPHRAAFFPGRWCCRPSWSRGRIFDFGETW